MSDATYTLGTIEYLMLEIDPTTPGFTFTPADWTAEVALVGTSANLDPDTAAWADAVIVEASGRYYVQALLGVDPDPVAGSYKAFVRLTPSIPSGETPILRARGTITIAAG